MIHKKTTGHVAAVITILIWGTTFISTKVLLKDFQPVEVLFFRFFLGFLALCAAYPHRLKIKEKKQEILFALAGLCGVTLYFLFENIALTYTMASNVGVIVSVSPVFTAIIMYLTGKEKLSINFFLGFLLAMSGICLISFNGVSFHLSPTGDVLGVGAAAVWACYSILTRKISDYGYHTIQVTRRIFAYGLIFMIPALFFFDFELNLKRFTDPVSLFNILFLGIGASAACFVTWNAALRILGAVRTSVYIYLIPVITVTTSVIVLHEKITVMAAAGTALTLAGLVVSEGRWKKKNTER